MEIGWTKYCSQGNKTRINIHPALAVTRIRDGVAEALSGELTRCRMTLPAHFTLKIQYRRQALAYKWGFFPGVQQIDATTIQLETENYFDVMRLITFAV